MSRVSKSQYALLGLLSLGPQTGYEIKKRFDGSLHHFWAEGFGQIYPLLKRLVDLGWAVQRGDSPRTGRTRKTYAITPRGLQALRDWLDTPAALPAPRNELLLKLFFGRHRRALVNMKDIQRAREESAEALATYREIERSLRAAAATNPELVYWLITLDYGQAVTSALEVWADRTLQRLTQLE